jgi:hypothetical protein
MQKEVSLRLVDLTIDMDLMFNQMVILHIQNGLLQPKPLLFSEISTIGIGMNSGALRTSLAALQSH